MEKILEVMIHQFSRPMNTKVSSLVCSRTVKSFNIKLSRPKKLDFLKIHEVTVHFKDTYRSGPGSYPAVGTEAVGRDL